MKYLSEKRALDRLAMIKAGLRDAVSAYEQRAKCCLTCDTPGACCLDAHFVNIHISRLEVIAIRRILDGSSEERRVAAERRIDDAVERYQLTARGDTFQQRFACPLYEKGVGCLVHHDGKPSACIVHACYENKSDLPPDELQQQAEQSIDALNARTYAPARPWLPIPLALRRAT